MKLAKHEEGWRKWWDLLSEEGFSDGASAGWRRSPRLPNGRLISDGTGLVVQCGAIEKRNGKYRVKDKKLWAAICKGLRSNND